MTQYNALNVKLSNSQLNKLRLRIKIGTEVTLKISSNVVGASNDKNSLPHKLLWTNTQVSRIHKAFRNNSSNNIKLSKTQLHKIGQSGGFLGKLLGPLLKTRFLLMKNVLKPLAKSALILLRINSSSISNRCSYSEKNVLVRCYNINNFEWRNEWYYENS